MLFWCEDPARSVASVLDVISEAHGSSQSSSLANYSDNESPTQMPCCDIACRFVFVVAHTVLNDQHSIASRGDTCRMTASTTVYSKTFSELQFKPQRNDQQFSTVKLRSEQRRSLLRPGIAAESSSQP